jgi:UDP-N-acetylglucosamine 2-epimerase
VEIFYIANSIYQFAYALPVYQSCGGSFVVTSRKKLNHFRKHLKGFAKFGQNNTNQVPDVKLVPRNQLHQLKGVLVFFANSIDPGQDFSNAITCFYEHGTSDKRYEGGNSIAIDKLGKYDYLLLSGPKNKQRLEDTGIKRNQDSLIETGCLRFDDYLGNKFTREKTADLLNIKDRDRKNILYAPTWKFGNGTFKEYAHYFINNLTDEYNLILRPHYHDRRYGHFLYWISKLKGKKNLYFSRPQDVLLHDTYSAFAVSDLLISDISSVIYEYLITQKPIVLIENDFEQRHTMPKEMDIVPHVDHFKKGKDLLSIIENNLNSEKQQQQKYKKLLNNSFYNTEGGSVEQLSIFLKKLTTT